MTIRKRARRALVAVLASVLAIASLLAGCRSGRGGRRDGDIAVMHPDVVPTPVVVPIETPVATPTPVIVESQLELADRAFDAGDYGTARAGYEAYLAGLSAADLPDAVGDDPARVLYRLAVLNLAKDGGGRDPVTGLVLLRRIVREYPASPYRMEAELILGLSSRVDGLEVEVEKLEGQLEALKRIDLGRSQDRRSP